MQGILDIAIPAVVLIPIILIGVAVWIGLKYNEKSSVVRRAEFLRLQRLAVEEHERAEREFEQEYSVLRQGNPDPYYRRRESGENEYKKPPVQQEGWKLPEPDIRRRKQQGEEEEYHKRQAEADFHHRRMQAEADERRRREAAEDEIKKRKAEERERERRKTELEAHLRREAEEERRRRAEEDDANRRNEEEAQNRDVHPASDLYCLVCENPTKRRCSRCKSAFYWYVVDLFLRFLYLLCSQPGGITMSESRKIGDVVNTNPRKCNVDSDDRS